MTDFNFTVEAFAAKAREIVAEGCVLLRNENNALPIAEKSHLAVFGRTQMNYFKSGLGSGGLVNTKYVTGIYEALEASGKYCLDSQVREIYEKWTEKNPFDIGDGWAHHPWYQKEMKLDDEMVSAAAERNDAAIVIIGRTAGEDKDNMNQPGSWLLTDEESNMLEIVCRCFKRSIVLLNTGNIIDMNWVEKYKPSAVMYVWQGGQEGGSGVVDVLSGVVSPSGRLTDTIAGAVEDYPSDVNFGDERKCIYAEDIYVGYRYFEYFAREKVLYPFGEGLSYTQFSHEPVSFDSDDKKVVIRHQVRNIGGYTGKEVVQVYVKQPQGMLGKPALVLCGFTKTKALLPGESEVVEIEIPLCRYVSYDDSGATGYRFCYVLEKGEYRFYAGHSVRNNAEAGSFIQTETIAAEQLEESCAPAERFKRIHPVDGKIAYEEAPVRNQKMSEKRLERLPEEIVQTDYRGLKLEDVAEGRCSMNEFIAQMTDEDLCCIVRGEGMSSPRVTAGTAGAIGGVSERLDNLFGLPAACCADGPSGIRMDCGNIAFSMPNGTCQACSWNEQLITELYELEGLEMRKYQIDNLLGPGINIHRHPLCGRNFEYFSEDPLLTGRLAVAQLNGLHKSGVTGTIKHFACNNQEMNRRWVESVVSERALREIYLKGYEIAVKEGAASSVMTSYNPLNGCWTASHYEMLTEVLREEWGFDGIVMTDWWAMGSDEGEEPATTNTASMIRAQNDLFMVANQPSENSGSDNSEESLKSGKITRAEFQRSAANICRFLIKTPAFRRKTGKLSELDIKLQKMCAQEEDIILNIPELLIDEEVVIDGSELNTAGGEATLYQMKMVKHGQYQISVTCRASQSLPDTAQLPVSVFVDSQLLGSWVLSGGEKEWRTLNVLTREIHRRLIFYVKFFFAVGGLEVSEVRIRRIKTFE